MTSRRRASDAAAAFGRIGQGQETQRDSGRDAATSRRRRGRAPVAADASALTVRFDTEQAVDVDALVLELRRELGHRVDKAAVVRALLRIAAADEDLRDRLVAELATDAAAS